MIKCSLFSIVLPPISLGTAKTAADENEAKLDTVFLAIL